MYLSVSSDRFLFCPLQRPPSSSLSYPGAGGNDDARSPGSGGTPGPLSQQAPASLDSSDPGKHIDDSFFCLLIVRENVAIYVANNFVKSCLFSMIDWLFKIVEDRNTGVSFGIKV